MKTYRLLGPDGKQIISTIPGTLGGHRKHKIYGRLDCPGALRWIARGHYIAQRVFFLDEQTACAADYRPCANCLPERYALWKQALSLARQREEALALYRGKLEVLTVPGS